MAILHLAHPSISITNSFASDSQKQGESEKITIDITNFFRLHSQYLLSDDYIEHGETVVKYVYPVKEITSNFLQGEIEIQKLKKWIAHKDVCYYFRLEVSDEETRLQQDIFLDQFYRRDTDNKIRCHIKSNETANEETCIRFAAHFAPTLNLNDIKPTERFFIDRTGTKFIKPNDKLKACSSLSTFARVVSNYRNFFNDIYKQFGEIVNKYQEKIKILGDLYGPHNLQSVGTMNMCSNFDGRTTSKRYPDFQILQLTQVGILEYGRNVLILNGLFFNNDTIIDPKYSLTPSNDCHEILRQHLFKDKHMLEDGEEIYFTILKRLKENLMDNSKTKQSRVKRSWSSFWSSFWGSATIDSVSNVANTQKIIKENEQIIQHEFSTFKDRQQNISAIFQNLQGNMKILEKNERLLKNGNDEKEKHALITLVTIHRKLFEILVILSKLRNNLYELEQVSNLIFTDRSVSLFPAHLLKGITQNILKHKITKVDVGIENIELEFMIPKHITIKRLVFKMLPLLNIKSNTVYECEFPEVYFWSNLYLPLHAKKALNNFMPLSQDPQDCVSQLFNSYIRHPHAQINQCNCYLSDKTQDILILRDNAIVFSKFRDELKLNCRNNSTRQIIEKGYTSLKLMPYCNISTRHRDFIVSQMEKFEINASHISRNVIFEPMDLNFDSNFEIAKLNLTSIKLDPLQVSDLKSFNNQMKRHGHIIDYFIAGIISLIIFVLGYCYCCQKRRHKKSTSVNINLGAVKPKDGSGKQQPLLLQDEKLDNENSDSALNVENIDMKPVAKMHKRSKSFFSPQIIRKSDKDKPFKRWLNDNYFLDYPGHPIHQVLLFTIVDNVLCVFDNSPAKIHHRNMRFATDNNHNNYVNHFLDVHVEKTYFEILNSHFQCKIYLAADNVYRLVHCPNIYYDDQKLRWIKTEKESDSEHIFGIRKPLPRDDRSAIQSGKIEEELVENVQLLDSKV